MPFTDGISLLVTRAGGGIIYHGGDYGGVYICIYATIRAIKLHEQEGNSTSTRHSNTSVNPSKEMGCKRVLLVSRNGGRGPTN